MPQSILKMSIDILKKKDTVITVLCSCCWCIIPNVFYFFQTEDTYGSSIWKLVSSVLYITPICIMMLCIRRNWIYCLLSAILMLATTLETIMVLLYRNYLMVGNILSIVNTNKEEGTDFLCNSWFLLPYVLGLWGIWLAGCYVHKHYKPNRRHLLLLLLFSWLAVSLFSYARTRKAKQTNRFYIEQNILGRPPYNFFFQLYQMQEQMNIQHFIEEAKDMEFHSKRPPHDGSEIYVLAVGESCRYGNLSLAGYKRSTTPLLEQLENLTLFTDYYSTANLTMYSVPQIVTRATPLDYSLNYKEKSVYKPFQECGFKTYTICCHNLLGDAPWRYLVEGCDGLITVENDADIPHEMDSLISMHPKIFFILHFFGNHNSYRNFDTERDVYRPNPVSDNVPWSNEEASLNAYDNTILYTDYVLSSVINSINLPSVQSAFLFVSDHGEDFRPGTGGHGGNGHPNKEEYHVPFIFWHNTLWGDNHKEKVRSMLFHKDLPINADNVFYSVCDMGDITLGREYAKPEWSVFSGSFLIHDRYLIVPDGKNKIKL